MMKKVFMVLVAGTLVLSSCGNKKDFCECITEAMASEDANEYPEGCDYIKDMDEAEAGKKSMECLGAIFGSLGDAFGDAMEGFGDEMEAAMDAAMEEAEEVIEETEETTEL